MKFFTLFLLLLRIVCAWAEKTPSIYFDDTPQTKVGELYHKTAAKVDHLLGDEESKRRHETLLAEKKTEDEINEILRTVPRKPKKMFDKFNGWTRTRDENAAMEITGETVAAAIDKGVDKMTEVEENVEKAAHQTYEAAKEAVLPTKWSVTGNKLKGLIEFMKLIPGGIKGAFYYYVLGVGQEKVQGYIEKGKEKVEHVKEEVSEALEATEKEISDAMDIGQDISRQR
jgi:hypothetical protein